MINPDQVNLGEVKIRHTFSCPPTVSVRDAVYLNGSNQVDTADAAVVGKAPAVGIVETKPDPTTCVVVQQGTVNGFPPASFTPNEDLFLGTSGSIVNASGVPPGSGAVIQEMAYAISDTKVSVMIDRDYTIRP